MYKRQREGGVIDEILVENTFRNREGNPVLFDMVLIDKVLSEPNITLYLNMARRRSGSGCPLLGR